MQAQPRAANNARSSRVPNLNYTAISPAQLRRQPRFIALPPADALIVSSKQPATFRFVRQDTLLWAQLHEGMLTTGRMKYALGFHEQRAAKVLHMNKQQVGEHGMQAAALHMQLQPPRIDLAPAAAAAAAGDAMTHNEAARQLYNQQLAEAALITDSAAITEAHKAYCQQVALAGNTAVRLAWGRTQEASALYSVMQLFPASLLEEAGLWQVDAAQLPASWQLDARQLPALGASPDGLLVHTLSFSQADLQQAAATAGAQGDRAAALQLLQTALAALSSAPDTSTSDSGTSDRSGGSSSSGRASQGPSLASPTEAALLQLLRQQAPGASAPAPSSSGGGGGSTSDGGGASSLQIREVVEVKNHCCFTFRSKRRGRGGKPMLNYAFVDRGPIRRLQAQWVPQLQLHMLATGCMSALLVSRSVTQGINVFRMFRDDAYLRDMLALAAHLRDSAAAAAAAAGGTWQGVPPDLFWGEAAGRQLHGSEGYPGFLQRTVRLAESAECVVQHAGALHAPGSSLQPFL